MDQGSLAAIDVRFEFAYGVTVRITGDRVVATCGDDRMVVGNPVTALSTNAKGPLLGRRIQPRLSDVTAIAEQLLARVKAETERRDRMRRRRERLQVAS